MFQGYREARGSRLPTHSHSEMTETLGMNEISYLNTRSNAQLQDMSKVTHNITDQNHEDTKIQEAEESHQQIAQEGEGESEKSELEGEGEGETTEGILQNYNFIDNKKDDSKMDTSQTPLAGGRLVLLRKKEEEEKQRELQLKQQEEKEQYIKDMFGYNFDISKVTQGAVNAENFKVQQFKDESMKALQDKSFQGLYLRLQFWINQIYKRLHTKKVGCGLKLDKNHVMIMKTIICFLSYMRDVVMDLKDKGIEDDEAYDWQKQIRLTWEADKPACKVE